MQKRLILLFVVCILGIKISVGQETIPLSSFDIFHIGMSEDEFRDAISLKYEIIDEGVHERRHFHSKLVDLNKHNLSLKYLLIKTPNYRLGNTGLVCDYFNLLFLNNRMYKINFWTTDIKLSKPEIDAMIRYLNSYFANQYKATKHYKPYDDLKIYSGNYVMYSEPLIDNKPSNYGTTLSFRYRVKNKHKSKAENKIVLRDNQAESFWKAHVLMTEAFDAKSLKAYNAFRNVNLGGSLSDFLKTHEKEIIFIPDSLVAEAYKDNTDVAVYKMHEAYVDVDPEPLPEVALNEIQHFFHNGLLTTITLILDPKVDAVKLENMLNQVYGPADKVFPDESSLRAFVSDGENFKQNNFPFSLKFHRGSEKHPPSLTFQSDYLFNNCKNQCEIEKAESIKSAF